MVFVTGFFHTACFQGSSLLQHESVLLSFLLLSNIPLHAYTTFCLFTHPLMDIWIVSTFWLLWIMVNMTLMSNFHVFSLQFFLTFNFLSFIAEYLNVFIYYILYLIYSFCDECLGCFHLLAIMNNTAMNISVKISHWYCFQFFRVCIQKWNCWIKL
jgi:hypothetical protein